MKALCPPRFSTEEWLQIQFFLHFTADSYLRHPNSYLPKYNIQSETEGESAPLTGVGSRKPLNGLEIGPHQLVESDDEDIQAYGFPQKRRNRREPSDLDLVLNSGGKILEIVELDIHS